MAATDGTRQFGARKPSLTYADRPCAYGIAQDGEGRIALVHVTKPEGAWHDLPGGAIDPGEDEQRALVREFGEETGLIVRPARLVARADQYMLMTDGSPVNNRAGLYAVEVAGSDAALKIEDDHELVWIDPIQALTLLRHDSHAWAVTAWLRDRASD